MTLTRPKYYPTDSHSADNEEEDDLMFLQLVTIGSGQMVTNYHSHVLRVISICDCLIWSLYLPFRER